MFNIGPLEMLVLAIIGLVVLGPDRLPDYARDAARLLRTLRDVATGARQQLKDELGPEFADVDLRNLNPRTAVQRALLGEEIDLQKVRNYNPRTALQDLLMGEDAAEDGIAEQVSSANGSANGHGANGRVSMTKPGEVPSGGLGVDESLLKPTSADGPASRPRPGPGVAPGITDAPKFDPDAT